MKMKVRCVKCLEDEKFFTVGKEYVWEDDRLTSDTGYTYTNMASGSDPNKWKLSSYYKFEVVPEFKVGDKVRIVGTDNLGKSDVGRVGVITRESTGSGYDWTVRFDKEYDFTHTGDGSDDFIYRWYKSEWLELVEEKHKHRFKVGDKVVALKHNGYGITTNGWKGVVVRQYEYPYGDEKIIGVVGVGSDDDGVEYTVSASGFELDKPAQPWKIVIESSGDTTTAKYIEGKTVVKTETVKRYHTDEYSVAKAVEAVTKKLFPEEETNCKCEVGDLVECIDSTYPSVFGKWGYLVRKDPDGTWLVDFKVEYHDCHDGNCLPGKTGLWLVEDISFKKVK